jgi:LysM repeat protein
MDTENPKPQTGGLKLMTVFIVVLLLHVAVIGSISAYHLLKGNTGDALANKTPAVETNEAATTKDPLAEGANPTTDEGKSTAKSPSALDESFVNTPNQSAAEQMVDAAPANAAATPLTPALTPESTKVTTAANSAVSAGDYAVAKGDTLSRIARVHGMKIAALRELNGLKNDNLKIGQKLKVQAAPVAEPTPNTSLVAKTVKAVETAAPKLSTVSKSTYTIAKGDTLVKIARQFKTTPAALMAANKIGDPAKLKIGSVLQIPGAVGTRNELSEQKDGPQPFKPVKPDHGDLVMVKP